MAAAIPLRRIVHVVFEWECVWGRDMLMVKLGQVNAAPRLFDQRHCQGMMS